MMVFNEVEACTMMMNSIDWFSWSLMLILGTWKLWELVIALGRWAERKVGRDDA